MLHPRNLHVVILVARPVVEVANTDVAAVMLLGSSVNIGSNKHNFPS